MFSFLLYICLSLASFAAISTSNARTITVLNSCSSTIWPAFYTGGSGGPDSTIPTGWELASGNSTLLPVSDQWTAGRIWARTGCAIQSDGSLACLSGNCSPGTAGGSTCSSPDTPPATLAEFTLDAGGEDNYDISLVDGFNIPLNIVPSLPDCPSPQCEGNINALCPAILRTGISENGYNYACAHPCNVGFGEETYGNRDCCTGAYSNSTLCQACGVDYYSLFKDNCNMAYAYAYDEKSGTALYTCNVASEGGMPDYTVEFCPGGSDYVGTESPSTEYDTDTATCTSIATTYLSTFTVGPSPTSVLTIGTLSVVATNGATVGGQAAVVVSSPSPVFSSSAAATTTTELTVIAATPTTSTSLLTSVSDTGSCRSKTRYGGGSYLSAVTEKRKKEKRDHKNLIDIT